MKNLLDLLHDADAIEIDGVLCVNFYLESESEEDDDIALDINYESEGNIYEHYITFAEMSKAEQTTDGHWSVMANNGEWDDRCLIRAFKLTELKLDKYKDLC